MPLPIVSSGELITAAGWNNIVNEVNTLGTAKVGKSGDIMTGPLSIQTGDFVTKLALAGGNWDVTNSQGDLRIGSAKFQLRIGVATGGGGAGDVRIRSLAIPSGNEKITSKLMLGVGNVDMCMFNPDGVVTFHDSTGATSLAIVGADLILPARTNPNWHVKNANGTRGNGNNCRALVNWKANANAPDELIINFGNDYAGGTVVDSDLRIVDSKSLNFGTGLRQMVNLWSTVFGIGIQDQTAYFRCGSNFGDGFSWFWGGTHNNARQNPGGGRMLMSIARIRSSILGFNFEGTKLIIPGLFSGGGDRSLRYNTDDGSIGYDTSSARYKINIAPLKDDFKKILMVQPSKFSRYLSPDRQEIGYIAEEFAELGLTNLIFYDKEGNPDGLDYEKICIYLLEVVKEHEALLNPDSPYLKQEPGQKKEQSHPTTLSTRSPKKKK